MSILNVNQLQPVGGGNTITVSAPDVSASAATITVATVQVGSATTIHTTGIDLGDGNIQSHNINSTGIITATEVNVTGTLTYEDVTNIDAVGIITAQAGIHVTGGEVGIGLTNPTAKFQVNGISNGLQARFGGNGTGLGISCFQKTNNNAGVIIEAQDATHGTLTFKTAGAERLRIDSKGQLSSGGSTTAFDGTSSLNGLQMYYETDSGQASIGPYSSGGSTHLSLYTNTGGAAATEKLRITSTGNVAIGTDTISNSNLTIFSDGTTDNKPATLYQNALTGTGSGSGFYVGTNHNDQVGYVWNYEPHALSFATNNTARLGITSEGYLTPAPSGMMIRSGFYDPGTGSGARTVHSGTDWITLNVNGTGQVGHNIGKFSDDGLTYTKVSNNSHLNVSVCFPYYFDDSSGGGGGFGIRAFLSTDDGSNYYSLSGLAQGPAHGWGAGAYGGPEAGVFSYTWNTRMNSSRASTILAKTGTLRFYFEVRTWSGTSSIYMIDYDNTYPKKGSIIIQEIAE